MDPAGLLAVFLLTAAAALWVYRDAKSRDSHAFLWALSVILTGIFLPIPLMGPLLVTTAYLMVRPKGKLRTCPLCSRRLLHDLANCPHCKRAVIKDCHRCHEAVGVESLTCPRCHVRL